MIRLICVLKRFEPRPSDHDRAVEMSSPTFHQSRYNSSFKRTCFDHDQLSVRPRDQRVTIDPPFDPRPQLLPRILQV